MQGLIALGLFAVAGALILTRKDRKMSKLTDALDALVAEVQDSKTKLASIQAFIAGVPELVAQAVADALEAADVEASDAADLIDTARQEMSDNVDAALAAIETNTGEDTQPGEDTTTEPGGEDTVAGGEGEDTLAG